MITEVAIFTAISGKEEALGQAILQRSGSYSPTSRGNRGTGRTLYREIWTIYAARQLDVVGGAHRRFSRWAALPTVA